MSLGVIRSPRSLDMLDVWAIQAGVHALVIVGCVGSDWRE